MKTKKALKVRWPLKTQLYANGLYHWQEGEWQLAGQKEFSLKDWKSAVCLLAREHYIEEQRTYPISNLYHLYKIVQAEKQTIAPFDGYTFWAITHYESGNFKVVYCSVPSSVVDMLKGQFKFLVPETLLLHSAFKDNGIYSIGGSRGMFFARDNSDFVCMQKDALVDSPQRFCALLNKPHLEGSLQQVTEPEYQKILSGQLERLDPRLFAGLYIKKERQQTQYDFSQWKKPAILSGVVLGVYALGVTSYLNSKQADLDALLQEKRQEMGVLLQTERELGKLQGLYDAHYQLSDDFPGLSQLFSLLSSVKQDNVVVQNVRLSGNEVILRMMSQSATDIFAILAAKPNVKDLDFDGSIQKNARTGLDVYTLKFTLKRAKDSE